MEDYLKWVAHRLNGLCLLYNLKISTGKNKGHGSKIVINNTTREELTYCFQYLESNVSNGRAYYT